MRFLGLKSCVAAAILTIGGFQFAAAQELRVAIPDIPNGRGNPWTASPFTSPTVFFNWAVWDGLTAIDEKGAANSRLAASWENIDKDTWRFRIRAGAKFSNGKPVTAAEVAKTIEMLLSDFGQATALAGALTTVGPAKAISELVVEIKTKQPNPIFHKEIGGLPIMDIDHFNDVGPEGFATNPVSTGSYKTIDWGPNAVKLVSHGGSWHPGKIATILMTEVPERQARVQALQSGQIDIAVGLNMDAFDAIESVGHKMYIAPAPVVYVIPLISRNRPNSPFVDVRVRRAVNYALDKDAMNQHLLRGLATVASQGATPTTYGYNPEVKPYPYDPEKAKQLLAEAGYPNGFKTTMEAVMSGSQTADAEIYQQVAIDLARVGVNVDVIPLRFGDWLKKWRPGAGATTLGFADMFGLGYFLTPELDAIRGFVNHWCDKKPQWYCNESMRPMVEQARVEFDPATRLELLQKLMVMVHDDAPVLFTVNQIDVVGVNKRVENFQMVNRFINYDEMTISK